MKRELNRVCESPAVVTLWAGTAVPLTRRTSHFNAPLLAIAGGGVLYFRGKEKADEIRAQKERPH